MEQGNNKLSSIPMLSEILDKTNEEICNQPQIEYINEIVNSFGIGQKSPIHPTIIFGQYGIDGMLFFVLISVIFVAKLKKNPHLRKCK